MNQQELEQYIDDLTPEQLDEMIQEFVIVTEYEIMGEINGTHFSAFWGITDNKIWIESSNLEIITKDEYENRLPPS